VLSSRIIPGNEKAIYRMVDHLFRREAFVIYDDGSYPPVFTSADTPARRNSAHHQSGAAEVFHSDPRRIPAAQAARRAGRLDAGRSAT
jgi:hypothetical protein